MSEIIIENVTQFVEAIRNIATNDQTELFFRGHADRAYVAEPAIFRNKEHLKNEKYLFNDMVTQCPEEFKDCQYTFEYLVKMQHYGLPTRLLDITSNALVALYFACCSLSGEGEYKDGQVLVYQVQKGAIKNYNSDTVSVLSNLAHLNSDFELYTEIKPIYLKNLMEAYVKLITLTEGISELKRNELVLRIKDPQIAIIKSNYKQEKKYKEVEIIELIERIVQIIQFELRGKIINLRNFRSLIYDVEVTMRDKKIYFCNLKKSKNSFLLFIKQEKNYFIDQLTSEYHLKRIVCVRAKLNNPRIIRQGGLFFLFGMGNTKNDFITFANSIDADNLFEKTTPTIQEITNPTILISGQAKQTIIKELRALGISEETLMPEIDSVAKSIKNRYSH